MRIQIFGGMGWLGPVNNEMEILEKYSAITMGGSKRLVFVGSLGTSSIFGSLHPMLQLELKFVPNIVETYSFK